MRIAKSVVTVEPLVEPVTVSQVKAHLKIEEDFTTDDVILSEFITSARKLVEETTGRSLMTQTRVLKFDTFPCFNDAIYLDYGRLLGVTSVEYYDDSEALTTLASSDYWVDDHSDIPRIIIKNSWPTTYDNRPNSVIVTYTAGYGAASTNVPAPLKLAVKEIVAAMYDHRGDEKGFDIPGLAMTHMGPYIITSNAWY